MDLEGIAFDRERSLGERIVAIRALIKNQFIGDDLGRRIGTGLVARDQPLLLCMAVIEAFTEKTEYDYALLIPLINQCWLPRAEEKSIRGRSIQAACRILLARIQLSSSKLSPALLTQRSKNDEMLEEQQQQGQRKALVVASNNVEVSVEESLRKVSLEVAVETILSVLRMREGALIKRSLDGINWRQGESIKAATTTVTPITRDAGISRELAPKTGDTDNALLGCLRRMLASRALYLTPRIVSAWVTSYGDEECHAEMRQHCCKNKQSTALAICYLEALWAQERLARLDSALYDKALSQFIASINLDTLQICVKAPRLDLKGLLASNPTISLLATLAEARPSARQTLVEYLVVELKANAGTEDDPSVKDYVNEILKTLADLYEKHAEQRAALDVLAEDLLDSIPRLALALLARHPGTLLFMLMTRDSIDADAINNAGFPLLSVNAKRLARLLPDILPLCTPAKLKLLLVPLLNNLMRSMESRDILAPVLKDCLLRFPALDIRLLLPVIHLITRVEEIDALLPRIIQSLLEEEDEKDLCWLLFAKLLESNLINLVSLFVKIHYLDGILGAKACIAALQLCFLHPAVFDPETLGRALTSILDQNSLADPSSAADQTLPALYMRSLIQAAALHRTLHGLITGILAKLFTPQHHIWSDKSAWRGLPKALSILLPNAISLLLQLPEEHLRDLISRCDESTLRMMREHLWEQTPSVRRRFISLMHLLKMEE